MTSTPQDPAAALSDASLGALLARPVERLRVRVEGAFLKADLGEGRALRLDAEGRWGSLRLGRLFLRRRVDGVPCLVGPGPLPLDLADGSPAHEAARRLAGVARALLDRPDVPLELSGASDSEARARLEAAGAWTTERFLAERGRFAEAYPEAVPILPPDRYRDLVVLPATGCPYGRCTFCAWYRDARFAVTDEAGFERHLDLVAALFGRGAPARDGLFLGSASAFSVPDAVLLRDVARTVERFGRFPRGIAGFLDPDHAPRRGEAEWRRLAEAGVVRVMVGLETGDPDLRLRLGKADPARLAETVGTLRAAGITAGLSVLAGAGAPADDAAHLEGTARLVAALGLDARDVVYVSPLAGARPPEDLDRAAEALASALRAVTRAKVAPYRMDLYRYFA